MIILKIFLFLLLFLLTFIIFIVLILIFSPIKGQVWCTESSLKFRGKYLFGAFKIDYVPGHIKMYLFGLHLNKKNKSQNDKKETSIADGDKLKSKKKKRKEKKKRGLPSKTVIFLTFKLIKKLIRRIAPRTIHLDVALGLDDPFDSGMICLINQTLVFPLNRVDDYDIKFTPIYDDLDLKIVGYAKVKFSIVRLLMPILFCLIKKPIRNYLGWGFKWKK